MERLVPVLAMVRLIGLISLIVEYVCVFNRILHESCSRAETNILNNTGKLKSDIYRRGEKWMDFPVENPRWNSIHSVVPGIWIRDDIPLCSGTDRIFKRSLNRLTVAW